MLHCCTVPRPYEERIKFVCLNFLFLAFLKEDVPFCGTSGQAELQRGFSVYFVLHFYCFANCGHLPRCSRKSSSVALFLLWRGLLHRFPYAKLCLVVYFGGKCRQRIGCLKSVRPMLVLIKMICEGHHFIVMYAGSLKILPSIKECRQN